MSCDIQVVFSKSRRILSDEPQAGAPRHLGPGKYEIKEKRATKMVSEHKLVTVIC